MQKILQGYKQFKASATTIAPVQNPKVMVISCCDSRVDPAILLNSEPGDLFIVRNIANIVPSYDNKCNSTSAALEYGINHLKVTDLVIIGHSQCGGIKALFDKDQDNEFIQNWVKTVKVSPTPKTIDEYAKATLKKSYDNCLTYPWISSSNLNIHLWFFEFKNKQIYAYSKNQDIFNPLG